MTDLDGVDQELKTMLLGLKMLNRCWHLLYRLK